MSKLATPASKTILHRSVLVLGALICGLGIWFLVTFDLSSDDITLNGEETNSAPSATHVPEARRGMPELVSKPENDGGAASPTKTSPSPKKARRARIFFTDEVGERRGVASASFLIGAEEKGPFRGSKLLMQGQADADGRFVIPRSIRPPFQIHVTEKGFLSRSFDVELAGYDVPTELELEIERAQSSWVSVRLIRKNGGAIIEGPRIAMSIQTSCDMIRTRWRIETYESIDELPVLRAGKKPPRRPDGQSLFTPIHLVKTRKPKTLHGADSLIGELRTGKQKQWIALFWEDMPIKVAEIPAPGRIVEFVLHEADLTSIEPSCHR